MNKQRGFGLIEVLISMLVFAVGAVALVKLQGELIQGGSNANARSVALSIAQEKLDDLRAFQCVSPTDAAGNICNPASSPLNPGPTFFSNIADNAGGQIASGTITRGAASYALSWSIVPAEVVYNAGSKIFEEGNSTTTKRVRVAVTWTDPDGTAQTVTLEDQINNKPPAQVALAMQTEGGQSMEGLDIPDDTQGDNLGVGVGDGATQKTTDPQMEISQNEGFVETQIETVTYIPSGGGNTAIRREAALVVNCECKQSGSGPGAEPARDELLFNAAGEVSGRVTRPGAVVNKPVGERISTGQAGQQSELCTECCNDHHDHLDPTNDNNLAKVYDPWRLTDKDISDNVLPPGTNDSSDGKDNNGNPFYLANFDHSHFFPDGSGVLQPANNLGDTYLESCRLQRIGGVFQVMQDWNLGTIKVMPECVLTGGCPPGTIAPQPTSADYLSYLEKFVTTYVNNLNKDDPTAIPDTSSVSFDNEPETVKLNPNETMQMAARAIYIDFLTPTEIIKLQAMNSADPGFVGLVPFEQVNMTKLANWSTTATDLAGVTNEPVKNDDLFSRGLVTALKGEPFVTATLQLSNTGFLGFETLLKVDEDDGTTRNDSLQLKISVDSTNNNKVSITLTTAGSTTASVALTEPPSSSCVEDAGSGLWGCTLDDSGAGKIQITYDSKSSPASQNRKLCYAFTPASGTSPSVATSLVIDSAANKEIVTFTLDGATDPSTLKVEIIKESDAASAGYTCVL